MKFIACMNCKHRDYSITDCFNTCELPIDILHCVENYFNDGDYSEELESDLSEIVKSMDKYGY